jgi:hypothetical protein
MFGRSRVLAVGVAVFAMAACEQIKSSNPLSPAIAGPIAGVTISAPQTMAPAANAQISVTQQPVTLTVSNATTTGVRPLTYVFDIAADPAFQSIVFTQTGVTPGSNGQTSLRLTQSLPAGQTYYWRAHAQDGANTGTFAASTFVIFTPVVIQPPTPANPANGGTLAGPSATLVVNDATRTGPAGAMSYVFQVATDPNLTNIVSTAQVQEAASQTSFAVPTALAGATTYYWRARALDPTHTSVFSAIWSFVTPASAPTTPTGPGPVVPIPGQNDTLTSAVVLNSPVGLQNWPITTQITSLNLTPNGVEVLFSKRDGPGRWPDVIPPGFSGPLEYTLGMCLNISGQWYCSAVIEFWNGLDMSGGPLDQYAQNWFYDPIRWAPMTGHQPAVGETIGFFVCAGDCRNNTDGSSSPVKERSNVVLVQMPTSAGQAFTFARNGLVLSSKTIRR